MARGSLQPVQDAFFQKFQLNQHVATVDSSKSCFSVLHSRAAGSDHHIMQSDPKQK